MTYDRFRQFALNAPVAAMLGIVDIREYWSTAADVDNPERQLTVCQCRMSVLDKSRGNPEIVFQPFRFCGASSSEQRKVRIGHSGSGLSRLPHLLAGALPERCYRVFPVSKTRPEGAIPPALFLPIARWLAAVLVGPYLARD